MPTIVIVPIVVLFLLIGLILLSTGAFSRIKGLRQILMWGGGLIIVAPLALIALFYLASTQTHKKYVGQYYGVTDQGHHVTLNLESNKKFTLRVDDCVEQLAGHWDSVLHDQYILELYLGESQFGIQAWLSDTEISFLNPLNESCLRMETLKMNKK